MNDKTYKAYISQKENQIWKMACIHFQELLNKVHWVIFFKKFRQKHKSHSWKKQTSTHDNKFLHSLKHAWIILWQNLEWKGYPHSELLMSWELTLTAYGFSIRYDRIVWYKAMYFAILKTSVKISTS
jgi:hypothetical protein